MPPKKNVVARQIPIYHPYQEYFDKLWSMTPSLYTPLASPFKSFWDADSCSKTHSIYIDIGREYKPEDIQTSIDNGKLKVSGKTQKKDENGSSSHEFSRQFDLPRDIDTNSMKTELDHFGGLRIVFKRTCPEHKPEFEDVSTPNVYHVKLRVDGYKPDDIKVKTSGKDLVVEAEKNKEHSSEDGMSHYKMSGHYKRHIYMGDDVEDDTVKAKFLKDGTLEVTAKRNPKKIKTQEKLLEIEHEK